MRTFWIFLTSVGLFLGAQSGPVNAQVSTATKIVAGAKLLMENKDLLLDSIQPFLDNKEGKTQEVRPFATLKASRLIVSEQLMTVKTYHWHENVFGRVEMHSTVPFKVLYVVDLREVRCSYSGSNKTLYVMLPPTQIEAAVTNHRDIQRNYTFGGWRSWSKSGTQLYFEKKLVPDARGEADKWARKNLPKVDERAQDGLRPFLTTVVRGIDPNIQIQIEN